MPVPFSLVCDLLEESLRLSVARKQHVHTVRHWFVRHRDLIDAPDSSVAALLSTLLPEKRTDRVYCIKIPRLEKIVGRALMLGSSRIGELAVHRQPGLGLDLADCVERILICTPNPPRIGKFQITVEAIDDVLHSLASKIRWSSPSIRSVQSAMTTRDQTDLEAIYRQLSPREAKWFTRLVLKDYQPLLFDPHMIYHSCDPILPCVLKIYDDFATAIDTVQHVRKTKSQLPIQARTSDQAVLAALKPRLSIKVGRQQWFKARSIKHCLDLCQGRISVESKLDGEYCQIHVEVAKGTKGIRIFSKSGKDSTEDRHALIGIISKSLRLGLVDSNVHTDCILEGELVVYSDQENKILPFHHIRKHVARRGRYLNTEQDSPPRSSEHLMIVYYDILLLDGKSLLHVSHCERFKLLEKIVHLEIGLAELVPRHVIDSGNGMAASTLRKAFAKVIVEKGEGLVLKPDKPYFNFNDNGQPFSGRCIKLKKEYIGKFGEVGDFAAVGAGFNPSKAKSYSIENLKWTHFFVGCLDNKEEVKRWGATPEFTIVNTVELNETTLKLFVSYANPMPVPIEENRVTKLKLAPGVESSTALTVAFTNPAVFDMRCFSFDKTGNTGFWSLRFPSVSKVHFDRDFTDCVSFEELQKTARAAVTAPDMEDSQENLEWIAKLERADPKGRAVDASTQGTSTTMPTPSPRQLTQSTTSSCLSPEKPTLLTDPQLSIGGLKRCKTSVRISLNSASPPRTLQTPPPVPKPDEVDCIKQFTDSSRCKRRQKTPILLSPKRRKSTGSQLENPLPALNKSSWSQLRRPLEDINNNSSQRSTTSHTSLTDDSLQLQECKVRVSSTIRTTLKPAKMSSGAAFQESKKSSNPCTVSIIVISDDEEEEFSQNTMPSSPPEKISSSLNLTEAEEPARSVNLTDQGKECTFAGGKCTLADYIILLPISATDRTNEMNSLLHSHNISNIVTDVEKWTSDEATTAIKAVDWKPGCKKIMLVDSVHNISETKALLDVLEILRKDIPDRRRDWIYVYDWKVLEYLGVLEDENVSEKYYDGFDDPWSRWYCGLI